MRRLAREARRFPDLGVAALDTGALSGQDAAFAGAVYDAVIRRWLTIEWVLDVHLKKPASEADPPVRAALLAGAAQILFMDRTPNSAAINQAVEWVNLFCGGSGGCCCCCCPVEPVPDFAVEF